MSQHQASQYPPWTKSSGGLRPLPRAGRRERSSRWISRGCIGAKRGLRGDGGEDRRRGARVTADTARSAECACYDAFAMQAPPGKGVILPEVRTGAAYDPDCRRCPRLAAFLDSVRHEHPDYFCRPVPPFGAPAARLVIVGLAPGMHGANRTGRPFTGDYAGLLLYRTLHAFGFASQPLSGFSVSATLVFSLVAKSCQEL